jgi:hypothetical protein
MNRVQWVWNPDKNPMVDSSAFRSNAWIVSDPQRCDLEKEILPRGLVIADKSVCRRRYAC